MQISFTSALRDVSDEVSKQLRLKELSETAEYILLYGKYEAVLEKLGLEVQKLLTTSEFAFGRVGDISDRTPYINQYHELYKQLVESFLKSREPVGPVVLKNLRNFSTSDPKPDTDFKSFARRSVQYVFDICFNELKLIEKFFLGGPLQARYSTTTIDAFGDYTERLEKARLLHVAALHSFLTPYLSNGDLHRVCDLVNWLETMYMAIPEAEEEDDLPQIHRSTAQALLNDHLWPLSDALFIKAATEFEHFKPSQEDLKIATIAASPLPDEMNEPSVGLNIDPKVLIHDANNPLGLGVSNAYPTVKIAVELLIMYNDSMYDRPVSHCSLLGETQTIIKNFHRKRVMFFTRLSTRQQNLSKEPQR